MFKKSTLALACIAIFATCSSVYAFEDVTPTEAHDMVTSDSGAYILDVRTAAEWNWVGHPSKTKTCPDYATDEECGVNLDGKVINISSNIDKKGAFVTNPSFLSDVLEQFGNDPNVTLILMCRSGSRSVAAANLLEANGVPYTIKNMVGGFEGGRDAFGNRTKPNSGWVNNGLPYRDGGSGAYGD